MRTADLQPTFGSFGNFGDLSPENARAWLAGAGNTGAAQGGAQVHAQGGAQGAASRALKNRHVGLLCDGPRRESADALEAAALALGATVVRLRPASLQLDEPRLRETARLLGRLYQFIGCEGVGPVVQSGLARWAGVPVLGDVVAPDHPVQVLSALLAMQEHAHRPARSITLALAAGIDATLAEAWHQAAGLSGLHTVDLAQLAGAAAPPRCDFVLRPGADALLAQPPTLSPWTPARGDNLAQRQAAAQQRLLQWLLTHLSG